MVAFARWKAVALKLQLKLCSNHRGQPSFILMVTTVEGAHFVDADRCLLRNKALLSLSNPDAAGLLDRRSNIAGWYTYWFSLSDSQLLYFERTHSERRGLLVGTISLFRHKLTIINSIKRRREFEILDATGKLHLLRAASDAELHWWVQLFNQARKKIPPAKPINPTLSPRASSDVKKKSIQGEMPSTIIDSHLEVDHVLCVVHGIGVSSEILSANTRELQESFAEIMAKVFPDVGFRIELLVIHWREALTNLDVHRKLQAVVPIAPEPEHANPLRQFMVHRIVDYVYYTHDRYRRHIMREVASQLNSQMESFRGRRPDFNGKISVMGHSLGAALCYDLMCRKVHDDQVLLESEGMRLNFDAANLFCVGNPLGTFLGLDPTIGLGSDMLTLPFRVFNIFKYHDPIATRLEPQRDLAMVDVCPVTVPCWFNMGLRESTAQWLGTLWPGGEKRKGPETPTSSNANGRRSGDSPRGEVNGNTGVRRVGSGSSELGIDWTPPNNSSTGGNSSERGKWPTDVLQSEGPSGIESKWSATTEEGEEVYGTRPTSVPDAGAVRLDFALQASSTMEDVSTSWSALKAHTEYWGNRDAMLLMVSCMMKSSFGIGDGWEPEADEVESLIVDKDILKKQGTGTGGGCVEEERQWRREEETLEEVVKQVVDRVVDEAVATHELMKIHPQLRIRSGGLTSRWPTGSQTGIAKDATGGSGGGWAAYLRKGWFGGEGKSGSGRGEAE